MHDWLLWATAAIWLGFLVYWNTASAPATGAGKPKRWISVQVKRADTPAETSDAAAPNAPASKPASRESVASRQIHQLLLWTALLLGLLPWFWPFNIRFPPAASWIAPTGFALQLAFAALYIQAKRHLGRYWAGTIRTRSDHKLIRTGPYRWLRHPMYTALLGMFLGTAIVWGQLHSLLAFAISIVAYARKIRLEERHLSTTLGPDYDTYRRESWALIPGLI